MKSKKARYTVVREDGQLLVLNKIVGHVGLVLEDVLMVLANDVQVEEIGPFLASPKHTAADRIRALSLSRGWGF